MINPGTLETHLRQQKHKLLVPYVTAGVSPDWVELIIELAHSGADAIEIGLPFSHPMLEGVTIQERRSGPAGRDDH